jgi:uridine kinase
MAECTIVPIKRSFRVGVAGGSASGKSALVNALVNELSNRRPALQALVLRADDYFFNDISAMPTFVLSPTGQRVPDHNQPDSADYPRLIADVDTRSAAGDAPDVLIVEGLMVLYVPELCHRFDLRVFVELDADERALRRMVRNMERQDDPVTKHDPRLIAAYYLESARVGHARYVEPSRVYADLILRGDADLARSSAFIADILCARVRGESIQA